MSIEQLGQEFIFYLQHARGSGFGVGSFSIPKVTGSGHFLSL